VLRFDSVDFNDNMVVSLVFRMQCMEGIFLSTRICLLLKGCHPINSIIYRYLLRTYSTVPRKHRMTIEEHQLFFVRRKEIDRFSRYRYSLFHCRFSQTCTNFLCRCDTKFIFGRKSATPPWRLISTALNALNGRFFCRNLVMIYSSSLSNL